MASHKKVFLLIAGAGLGLRLALAFSVTPYLTSDSREYHQYAASLVNEHRYAMVYLGRQSLLRGQVFQSYRPPGYPFFLALSYWIFGIQTRPVLVAQALLDFFSGIFLYLVARNWLSRKYSLWAFSGMMMVLVWVPIYMTEALFMFLFLFSLWVIAGKKRESWLWISLAGVSWAGIILVKPEKAIFVPLFFGFLAWKNYSRKGIARAVAFGLIICALLLPWLIREKTVHGQWVWITARSGRTFFDGSYIPIDQRKVYLTALKQGLNELEMDKLFYRVSLEYLRKHPGHYFRAGMKRLYYLWDLRTFSEVQALFILPILEQGGRFRGALVFISYFLFLLSRVIIVLGALGAIISWRRFRELFLIYSVPILLTLFHFLLFHGKARYLAMAYPCLCILSALWIRWLLRKLGLDQDEETDLVDRDYSTGRPEPVPESALDSR